MPFFLALVALVSLLPLGRGPVAATPPARYACDLRPGPPVRVRAYRMEGQKRVQVGPEFSYLHPGKMASAGDVDGDGKLDLLVLVYKTTRYDPTSAWRPFLYTLEDKRWAPKWLGSRVGHELEEAALVRTPGGVRMLALERTGEKASVLTLYHWRGFGFWGEWTSEPMPPASGLQVDDANGDGVDEVSVQVEGERLAYAFRGGGYVATAGAMSE
jgi:hypothetical protein